MRIEDHHRYHQRLVVSAKPRPGESLVGLIVSATHANGLGRPRFILSKIGVELAHIGTIGQYVVGREQALADHLGCEVDDVSIRAHPYVDAEQSLVRWGDATMRRTDLILDRRRIAPGALGRSDHHRAAWQCRHLPFDPSTFELIVDRCGSCATVLRWNVIRGIGACEHCRMPVAPARLPRLDRRWANDYRRFAELLSIDSQIRDRSRSQLVPVLANLQRPHLLDLILGLGLLTGDKPKAPGRRSFVHLDPYEQASASARGYSLLHDWPHKMQRTVSSISNAAVREGSANRVVTALKAMISERSVPIEVAHLMREALPEAAVGSRRMIGALSGGVMLASEISKKAGIKMAQVTRLAKAGMLPHAVISGRQRQNIQYEQAAANSFIEAWRSSLTMAQAASVLGVPHYAVWQLLWDKGLTSETNPGVQYLDPNTRLDGKLWAIWLDDLKSRSAGHTPNAAISLYTAMRQCGGGFKNWNKAFRQIRSGKIPFWHDHASEAPGITKRLFVSGEFKFGERVQDELQESKLLDVCPVVNQADACDILNLDPLQIRPLVINDILAFEKQGKGLCALTHDVLCYAKRTIAASELGYRLGVRNDAVHARLSTLGAVERVPGGWRRAEVEALISFG